MTGPRPLTRNQILENRAFLRALRKTGSANAAALETGLKRTTMERRRDVHPLFKQQWVAALVIADGALRRRALGTETAYDRDEPRIIRGKTGKLQLRRARRVTLTREVRQRFLLALSASANISLSAAAAGCSQYAFYQLRKRDEGFAREWRAALAAGYDRLEEALTAGALPENHEHDAWRHNDAPELPTMTANQMLQLMYLHQKEARLAGNPSAIKRRRGESREAYDVRMRVLGEARLEREREKYRVAEALRRAAAGPESPHEEEVTMPGLSQVSRAKPSRTAPYWSDRALFGGFRAEHLTAEQRAKATRGRG